MLVQMDLLKIMIQKPLSKVNEALRKKNVNYRLKNPDK